MSEERRYICNMMYSSGCTISEKDTKFEKVQKRTTIKDVWSILPTVQGKAKVVGVGVKFREKMMIKVWRGYENILKIIFFHSKCNSCKAGKKQGWEWICSIPFIPSKKCFA